MNDQAALLRQLMTLQERPILAPLGGPPVLVVGSGKGGVGKSVCSVLIASCLADDGHRVLLLDGAQNLGNLHVLLGVRPPVRLEGLMAGDCAVGDLVQPVTPNLWLLPADSGAEALYALSAVDQARLHHRLSALYDGFEAIVVDAGPGIEGVVRLLTMRGTRLLLVTMPEPAALTDAYALVKIVRLQLPGVPIDLVMNRTRDSEEGPAGYERLNVAAEHFLERSLGFLGDVPEDEELRHAVRHPGELLAARNGPAAQAIRRMVTERLDLPLPVSTHD